MNNMQPIDPIDECVRLGRELARLQKEYKDTLDEAVTVETERNALKRENAALRADKDRLNWLDSYISTDDTNQLFPRLRRAECHSIREAIDAARKEAQP